MGQMRLFLTTFVVLSLAMNLGALNWYTDDTWKQCSGNQEGNILRTSDSGTIEENFEDMDAGNSFETGRYHWTSYGAYYGMATAEYIGTSIMGRVFATSTDNYYMTYSFASMISYTPGVKIEFDMCTGATNCLRAIYLGVDGSTSMTEWWFIAFNWDGNIIAQHGDYQDVVLCTYTANTVYHVIIEFVGNMHTLDVSVNDMKYTNGGIHFSSRHGSASSWGVFRVHTRSSGTGWLAVDNIDVIWAGGGTIPPTSLPIGTWIAIIGSIAGLVIIILLLRIKANKSATKGSSISIKGTKLATSSYRLPQNEIVWQAPKVSQIKYVNPAEPRTDTCKYCGNKQPEGMVDRNFCPFCGKKLD